MDEIFTLYSFICQCNELFFFWNRKNRLLYWQINFPFYTLNLHWSACWVAFYLLPNTEKLDLFRHKTIYYDGLLTQYISVDMYRLPYRSVSRPIYVLNKIRVSLYARASKSSVFFSSSVLFFFQKTKQIQVTMYIARVQGFFYTIEDEGDLLVMNVVQYLQHVHSRNVLSNSCPCCYTPNRCCRRT